MSKRKCSFRDAFSEEYPGIKRSKKGDHFAYCDLCHSDLNISNGGSSYLKKHVESATHTAAVKEKNSHCAISKFLRRETPDDLKAAAIEGTFAFHAIKHHHSFNSADCTTHLVQSLFSDCNVAKKLTCGRTKMEAIIKGVLAPASVRELLLSLGNSPYSISTDASNHHETKTFPVVIRYFDNEGLQVKLLDFADLPGESSEMIASFLASVLSKHKLNPRRCLAFSADNANVNFGGKNLRGSNNVFARLRESVNSALIPVGCPAHIVHNAAKSAGESLSCDAEAIIFKIGSHFTGSTLRHEQLKDFCEFVEVRYMTLPSHTRTRWLTLYPIIERVVTLWPALKSYFLSVETSPKVLKIFFTKEESHIYFYFLLSVLPLFQHATLTLEKNELILPDMIDAMRQLREKLSQRKEGEFYGATTSVQLDLVSDVVKDRQIRREFKEFYETAIDYIDTWFHLKSFPPATDWLRLRLNKISYEDVRKTAEFLVPEVALTDSLFDEVTELNLMLQASSDSLSAISTTQKWATLLRNRSLANIREIVSSVLAIPTSNAVTERVFSLMNIQWSEERNRLKVDSVKAILQVVMNYPISCKEMYQKLLADNSLLKSILSGEKYIKS